MKVKNVVKNKIVLNLIASNAVKVVQIISSFVLGRIILIAYGSEINGLISSINQFISIISVTDMGVSTVVQSALYSPLEKNDYKKVSQILSASASFFRKISFLLIVYTFILCIAYPRFTDSSFDCLFIVCLIVILSINSITQYLFGVTRSILLNADQRNYIQSFASIVSQLLNLGLCYVLIWHGYPITIVKLVTAVCYLINPIYYVIYVKKHYNIDWNIKYSEDPISQKWDGFIYKITEYIYSYTDIIILTFFSSLMNVSVYSVYGMILTAVRQMLSSISGAIQPYLGLNLAGSNSVRMKHIFPLYEFGSQLISTIVFGCTLSLSVPFVMIYTKGISEPEYRRPIFSLIMTLATCLRFYSLPYLDIIFAKGHFKQTQKYYIWAAISNIVISLLLVRNFGLVGVAIGTFVSAFYNIIWQGIYAYRTIKIPANSICNMIRNIIRNTTILSVGYVLTGLVSFQVDNYVLWGLMAVIHFALWSIITLIVNFTTDQLKIKQLYNGIFRRL